MLAHPRAYAGPGADSPVRRCRLLHTAPPGPAVLLLVHAARVDALRTALPVLGAVAGGVVVVWLLLLGLLWLRRPDDLTVREALRLLPDVLRLVRRLAADRSLPPSVRIRLWLLLAYLVSPIDLVPDVLPVVGYADDAVLVVWVLRSVVRRAGDAALERQWPGTPAGLAVVRRLARLDRRPTAP
ncbi:MAG: uncharacterized protein JWR62_2359 [Modestobacter sp.]|nr:uncharacterized protein [Modestobacter sp.]